MRHALVMAVVSASFSLGCEPSNNQSNNQKLVSSTIEGLRERIERNDRMIDEHQFAPPVALRESCKLPFDKLALVDLEHRGPDALQTPLVLWGVLAPRPKDVEAKDYSHILQLEWLELGLQVSGFYIQIEPDENTHGLSFTFSDTIDESGQHYAELAADGVGRYDLFYFSVSVDDKSKQRIPLPEELLPLVRAEGAKIGIGLILTDGSRTKPGPLIYSEAF